MLPVLCTLVEADTCFITAMLQCIRDSKDRIIEMISAVCTSLRIFSEHLDTLFSFLLDYEVY